MATLGDLPADQRAVLQMVLLRGRTYDEIAGLLSIDRSAVRRRALAACDALTPEGVKPGPEQMLVTDYLLSQLPQQVAERVYIYLAGAADDRDWAHAVADQLDALASAQLPQIPVAAPLRSDVHTVDDRPDPPLAASRLRPRPVDPRGLRKRLPLVYSGAAVLAAVILLLVVHSGASSSTSKRTQTDARSGSRTSVSTAAATTPSAAPDPLAAVNLSSPDGGTQTLGVAQVVRDDGVVGIVIDAQGVPENSAHNAYGIWLYNSATSHEFVGFDPNLVGKNGRLAIEGRLPADAVRFRRLLVTLETRKHPKTPGEVVLAGPFTEK